MWNLGFLDFVPRVTVQSLFDVLTEWKERNKKGCVLRRSICEVVISIVTKPMPMRICLATNLLYGPSITSFTIERKEKWYTSAAEASAKRGSFQKASFLCENGFLGGIGLQRWSLWLRHGQWHGSRAKFEIPGRIIPFDLYKVVLNGNLSPMFRWATKSSPSLLTKNLCLPFDFYSIYGMLIVDSIGRV